jgi:hypothetical protein
MLTVQQFDEYIKALSFHDWTYDYSDDGNVWRAGRAAHNKLLNEAKDQPLLKAAYAAWSAYIWANVSNKQELKTYRETTIAALREQVVHESTVIL